MSRHASLVPADRLPGSVDGEYGWLFRKAVSGAEITVCRLRAPVQVLQERIRQRELGAGLEWHLERAVELAEQFERVAVDDFVVDTADRSVIDIAQEILVRARWIE